MIARASISIRSTGSAAPQSARLLPAIAARGVERDREIDISLPARHAGRRRGAEAARPRAQGRHLVPRGRTVGRDPHLSRLQHRRAHARPRSASARPKDFDLVRFWTASSRAYEVGLYRGNGPAARLAARLGAARIHRPPPSQQAAQRRAQPPDERRLARGRDPDRIDRAGRLRPAEARRRGRGAEARRRCAAISPAPRARWRSSTPDRTA